MRRSDLRDFHYLTPMENLPSIAEHGILSFDRAAKLPHSSIAAEVIQDRRTTRQVPGGRPIHKYANLYINVRNPMMFVRKGAKVVVISVKKKVLDLPEVVVADGNASSDYTRFDAPEVGIHLLDEDVNFAERWDDHSDQVAYWAHKRRMCAEVLVPDSVDPSYIRGVYLYDGTAQAVYDGLDLPWPGRPEPYLFFNGPKP